MNTLKLWFMRLFAKEPKTAELYQIDLSKKYILVFDEPLSAPVWEKIKHDFDEWFKNDKPFLLINGARGSIRLIKQDE